MVLLVNLFDCIPELSTWVEELMMFFSEANNDDVSSGGDRDALSVSVSICVQALGLMLRGFLWC